jgi:hypothetical protein
LSEPAGPPADERAVASPALLRDPIGPPSLALRAAGAWAASRACLLLLTYFAVLLLNPSARSGPGPIAPHAYTATVVHPGDLILAWKQWDAAWYLDIAAKGYWTAQASAFFPLYPLLVHLTTAGLGALHLPARAAVLPVAAAMLVSGAASLVALASTAALAMWETGSRAVAWRSVVLLVSYPLAFFLAAPYTEATFLALAALALLSARRGRWKTAGVAALGAGLTRSTGLILVLPLAWEFGRQHGWWTAAAWRDGGWRSGARLAELARGALLAASAPLALLGYTAYLWHRFGHPLAFVAAERVWGRQLTPPWETAGLVVQHLASYPPGGYFEQVIALNVVMLLGFAALTAAVARRMPFAFTLYMAGLILLSIVTPALDGFEVIVSTDRFLLAGLPAFLGAALLLERRPSLELLAVGGGFVVQAVLASFFLTSGWVA